VGETPLFFDLIVDVGQERDAAQALVEQLRTVFDRLEALHEPSAGGDCPTCGVRAPCVTLQVLHREITLEQAFEAVRSREPIDLTAVEAPNPPPVPSIAQLLADRPSGADRFFAALLDTAPKSRNDRTA
jgi:hypothetical protein